MPVRKLKEFLDSNNIRYVTIRHSTAYTAQEIAASAHIKGKDVAKTVIVKIAGKLAMAVVPASVRLDMNLLREAVAGAPVELAGEVEFRDRFPDCETGAMPPFGNLYDMEVFVAKRLAEDAEIAFNAGTHTELFQLAYADFERLVKPRVVKLSHA